MRKLKMYFSATSQAFDKTPYDTDLVTCFYPVRHYLQTPVTSLDTLFKFNIFSFTLMTIDMTVSH